MKELILKIEETTFDDMCGFIITTTKQTIKLGISDYQCCCENYGYFMSEDNLNEFINSELIKIEIADTLLKENTEFDVNSMYEGDVMFVNIHTNNGLLQFVAYNEHNGYYGHTAIIKSEELNYETVL